MCRNRSTKQKKQVVSYQQLVMELDLIFIVHGVEGGKDRLFLLLQKADLMVLKVMQLCSLSYEVSNEQPTWGEKKRLFISLRKQCDLISIACF